jgi:hypothetical protein
LAVQFLGCWFLACSSVAAALRRANEELGTNSQTPVLEKGREK